MTHRWIRNVAAAGLALAGIASVAPDARGDFNIQAAVGGSAFSGATYATFDGTPYGNTGGTNNGVAYSFAGSGATKASGSNSQYTAPVLSGSNNKYFGTTYAGSDNTNYLTTGPGYGTVTLGFSGGATYLGLLWGSTTSTDTLTFYDTSGSYLGTVYGSDVETATENNTTANGTYYVNILSTVAFSRVVATNGGTTAFEFDNVAYSSMSPVPEPSSLVLCGVAGVIGLGSARFRNRKQARAALA